jgi:hypothetical protein
MVASNPVAKSVNVTHSAGWPHISVATLRKSFN